MLLAPDPSSAFLDPFAQKPTLALICNIRDRATGQNYGLDPRHIAQKAHMMATDFGEAANFGVKLEHFVCEAAPGHQGIKYSSAELMQEVRAQVVVALEGVGIAVERGHMRFAPLTRMADNVMIYKYVIGNVARQHGLTAMFMPEPLFGDRPAGMRIQQSIWAERAKSLRRRRL
jgi:glutamine synthetase